jgi:hypothetical protein
VDAETEFLNDLALIAQLVAKLPQSWQERWHLDRTDPSFKQNKLPLGQKFVSWLDRQSEAANSARLTQMSLDLAKQIAKGAEVIKCGRCSKAGHRTGDCKAAPGGGGSLGGVEGSGFTVLGTLTSAPTSKPGVVPGRGKEVPDRSSWALKMTTEEGCKEVKAILEARDSHCPVCKGRHQYRRQLSWGGEMDWPSDRLDVCPSFENLHPTAAGQGHRREQGMRGLLVLAASKEQVQPQGTSSARGQEHQVPGEDGRTGVRKAPSQVETPTARLHQCWEPYLNLTPHARTSSQGWHQDP